MERLFTKKSSQYSKAIEYCSELKKCIEVYEKDRFDDWIESVRQGNIVNLISVQTEDSVLQFIFKSGKLFVNYDDHLISVIRDVRQLMALGLSVPLEIKKASDMAQHFYHKSITLKQIAHFYNTIDTQMLAFQQPMMLGLAVQFEKLIKDDGKKDEKSGEDAQYETAILEKAIIKIGHLLALGFGDAGAKIIAQNIGQ